MGGIVIVDSVSGGTTDGANKDLSNLSVTGEARFTAKAGVDLDNISSAGVSVITSYATGGGANTDLSNLSVTGQAVIDGKANTDLDNLSVTGEARFKAPALISSDADNGLTSGTDDKLYIDVDVSGKANTDLDNITSAGTSVITSLIASNITGKTNTDLDNITTAGTSVITSLVASGITGKANVDLDNLSVTGEARFTAKAGVDLDNISSAGVSVITSYATGGGANTDLSNLSVTGQAVIDGKANTDLDNITSTGKETVVGWGMPDYSAEVIQVWDTEYTATEDRNVFVSSGDFNASKTHFIINGIDTIIGFFSSNAGTCANSTNFLLKKGTVYKATGGYSNKIIRYQPLTGVN